MERLKGKVALITGSGSGIGRAGAQLFAREGAKIAVVDIVEEGGKETVSLIKDQGGEAVFIHADVTEPESVEQAVKAAVAHRRVYDPIAEVHYTVETPGPCSSNLAAFPFKHVRRPVYPLD